MELREEKFFIKTIDELNDDEYKQVIKYISSDREWVKSFKPAKVTDRNFRDVLKNTQHKFKFEETGKFVYMVY